MRAPDDFLTKLSIRTVDEIQRHIIKRSKRNVISRHYHAKDDKEAIASWRLELDRILPVFNVCPITPARRLLTFRLQIELGVNTHATVSGTHQDIANEHTVGSDVANAQTIVSDTHLRKSKGREGADGRSQTVGITRTLLVAK